MKISNKTIWSANILCLLAAAMISSMTATSCSEWVEPEAENYFEPKSDGYRQNIKDYLNSPHKVMFGWFGNWGGKSVNGSQQYALTGLPDSVDFVSLWLCWGPLSEAQQQDLREFQERGSRAVLCWRCGNIGDNLTPSGENVREFWGFSDGTIESRIAAAEKYAMAIVDTCRKYNIDGFDYDCEDSGTLFDEGHPEVVEAFMLKMADEFDKDGRMLVVDIPEPSWAGHRVLSNEVFKRVKYVIWQTYERGSSLASNVIPSILNSQHHPSDINQMILNKSIFTATFERATDKHYFLEQAQWGTTTDYKYAGHGAYHIEYDYPGNPDYPDVRKAISIMNPHIGVK